MKQNSRNPYTGWNPEQAASAFPFPFREEQLTSLGFSLDQLDALCEDNGSRQWAPVPASYWDSELYSQGLLLRAMASWPTVLPIPICGDHGASATTLWPRAFESNSRDHLTPSAFNYLVADRPVGTKLHLIPSPWGHWIRSNKVTLATDARGTLAFIPHLLPGDRHDVETLEEYVNQLTMLPEEYQPVVACVHMHDARSGLAERLKGMGLAVVTAGNTSHPLFFLRWIAIARLFNFATSPSPGSELIHFHLLGGKYFIHGTKPTFKGPLESKLVAIENHRSSASRTARNAAFAFRDAAFAFPPKDSAKAAQSLYVSLFTTLGPRMRPVCLRRLFVRRLLRVGLSYWARWILYLVMRLFPSLARSARRFRHR